MKAIKKPVPVEVWQVTKYDWNVSDSYPKWVNDLYTQADIQFQYGKFDELLYVELVTLEGVMTGHQGDYLVKGNHDDVWIVQQEIFEETYDIMPES